MTREEAIRHGKEQLEIFGEGCEHYEFIKMAIKALEQEATLHDDGTLVVHTEDYKDVKRVLVEYGTDGTLYYTDEPCDDAISREAVLKKQYRIDDSVTLSTRDVVNVEDIEDEPSVTPSRRKGHWIHFAQSDDCSECGWSTGKYISPSKFCPNCGARMESEE